MMFFTNGTLSSLENYSNGKLVRGKEILSTSPTVRVTTAELLAQQQTVTQPTQSVTVTTGMDGSTTSTTNTYSY